MQYRTVCCLAAIVLAAGCSTVPPLRGAQPSAEALAAALVDGVARRDRAALEAMSVSEREFRDHVWPQLPAARPERNLPFSYVWGDLRQKSDAALAETLARQGGRRFELVRVEFAGEADFGTYRVHREPRIVARDASGEPVTVRLCGSMLEVDGHWKIFSYIVDD